jgi:hypothetical protein|tara:strand:+ start:153 stop:431 length:279 start_codon:yes stop_codon:yes gene_type:complete
MSLTFGRKGKNTVPGVSSKMLNEAFNVKPSDSLLIAPNLSELKLNITDATRKTGEDIFDYPIKNTILQQTNKQGESLMGSFKYTIVPKEDIK